MGLLPHTSLEIFSPGSVFHFCVCTVLPKFVSKVQDFRRIRLFELLCTPVPITKYVSIENLTMDIHCLNPGV